MMIVMGGARRTRRRSRRSVSELDLEGRARLQRLVTTARLVVMPTSEAISRIESRLAPGTVALGVACATGLGVDQTVAVSEVLAAKGYDVTPHLSAREISTPRHLNEILQRLARRSLRRVLVVRGRGGSARAFPTVTQLLEEMRDHPIAPEHIGIAANHEASGERRAARLLERAANAGFVSTRAVLDPGQLLAWVAEMRVRGLGLPIEAGVPGVIPCRALERGGSGIEPAVRSVARIAAEYDPTGLVAELAAQQMIDRLNIDGLRLETMNEIEATANWRQTIYDLTQPERVS